MEPAATGEIESIVQVGPDVELQINLGNDEIIQGRCEHSALFRNPDGKSAINPERFVLSWILIPHQIDKSILVFNFTDPVVTHR